MNITNYELINSIANNTLNVTKNPEGNYDTLALKIFRSDCPYFAAPVNEVTINGETIFKYDLANFTAIENINMKMTSNEFMQLLKNLITPLTECCDWMLDGNYFVMNTKYVFISSYDYRVRYIYSFDLDNRCDDKEITAFFSEVIKNVRITDSTDLNNVLLRMIVDNNVSIASLLDMISRYGNKAADKNAPVKNTVHPVQPVEAVAQEPQAKKPEKTEVKFPKIPVPSVKQEPEIKETKPENAPSSERDDAMEKLFGGSKPKKPSAKKQKEKKPAQNEAKPKESLLSFLKKDKSAVPAQQPQAEAVIESDETVFEFGNETEFAGDGPYFVLKEKNGPLNAPQRIDIVFDGNGEMYIGRQSDGADFIGYKFDSGFKKISRRHAKITGNQSEYFITDLGSANKTIMNGQTLRPNETYPLSDGSVLIFGDSLYVYEFRVI